MPAKGKHIKAQLKTVDGHLCMLLGSSKSKAVKAELFWSIRGDVGEDEGECFINVLTFPGLAGQESSAVSMVLDGAGGQAAYANSARKCDPADVPNDCPVFAILGDLDENGDIPKPPKKKKDKDGDE